jgi:alkanesulfonate monooxygenase SsuD/methylene tetrahydromethanopterin reductase-like flavin-dependent oxidoreductase (luciferase family)
MMVERAAVAYDAGLESLSVGDHHTQRHSYMQNTPTLGRLLAEWPDRPAGCLFLLPLWNPVLVAEHVGTLAAMVDAPFIVQTGIGGGETQFAAFGADLRTRGRVTDESIRVVQALLAGDVAESAMLGIGPVSIGLRPEQNIEWWIGGHAEASLRRAAALGTAWYGGPGLRAADSEKLIAGYRSACTEAGSSPRAIVRRDVLVLADGDLARAKAADLVDRGYRGMNMDQLVVGDLDDAGASLRVLADLGYDDVIIRCMTGDQADALESIRLLGELDVN